MASIDKTYITNQDNINFITWYFSSDCKIKTTHQLSDYLFMSNDCELILWNTTKEEDYWLMKYCPLSFIRKRLKEQYGYLKYELVEEKVNEEKHLNTTK